VVRAEFREAARDRQHEMERVFDKLDEVVRKVKSVRIDAPRVASTSSTNVASLSVTNATSRSTTNALP
jgi:hypothetical protein